MFFKKKVGKGVRGEGKNLQSVFIILFFFFPLAQGQSRKMGAVDFWGCRTRLPGFVCAGFAGSTWGCAPPGTATGPAAAPCLLLPKYRGHSVQPQAVVSPWWHGDPRPPWDLLVPCFAAPPGGVWCHRPW